MPYQYQPLLKQVLPTIEQVIAALAMADIEDEKARDVRPMMAIIKKLPRVSPRLGGHIQKRKVNTLSYNWKISPVEKADAEGARQAYLRIKRVARRILNGLDKTPMQGVEATELNWITGGVYGTTPVIVKRYGPTELEQNGADPLNIAILADQQAVSRTFIRDLPRQSWIVDCDESDLRGGILRTLFFHEILLDETVQEWGSFNRKIKGIIQSKYKQWATAADKKSAVAALKGIAKHNYAATSDQIEFVLTKIADAAAATSFKELRAELALDRSIAILGEGNVSSLPQDGARSAVMVQDEGVDDVGFSDMWRITNLMNDQLVLFDYQINVDPNATEAPWQFEWDIAETYDAEKEIRVVAEAKDIGLPLIKAEVYRRIGYSQPAAGDEVLDWSNTAGGLLP